VRRSSRSIASRSATFCCRSCRTWPQDGEPRRGRSWRGSGPVAAREAAGRSAVLPFGTIAMVRCVDCLTPLREEEAVTCRGYHWKCVECFTVVAVINGSLPVMPR
jgi:hypothetical protein